MSSRMGLISLAVVGVVCMCGCSQDDRDEIATRGGNAWGALKGETTPGERTPRVVKEQQRKERIRQNNTWTPENRAHHPVEYCQAQLEVLQRHSRELEARAHEKSCAIATVKRTIGDNEAMEKSLKKFIDDAKKIYKECEAANSWPAKLGGYTLSREKTQEKIIDAAQKLAEIQLNANSKKNQLVALEKTLKITQDQQKHIVKIREQVQNTINDLRIKKVIEGDNSIVATLNAIEDNMGTLGANYDDPKIENIIQPDEKTTREELFKKIMAE
ncbi:MAG: hypothetical protein IKO72_14410 [Kiritimatiellae bacterium]|nr:hypothetical protein [Kiritimatiellia bacterium]